MTEKYNNEIFRKVLEKYNKMREDKELTLKLRKSEIYKKFPAIKEIDLSLSTLSIQLTKAVISGEDVNTVTNKLKEKSEEYKKIRERILMENGYPKDYISLKYNCPICNDFGFIGTKMCECFKNALMIEKCDDVTEKAAKYSESFENFRLDVYSDTKKIGNLSHKKIMTNIRDYLYKYTLNFAKTEDNLLLSGCPGVGKTYLAKAIVRELEKEGYDVIFDTAQNIFDAMEADKFGRGNGEYTYSVKNCDFLIIDDLGTEFINNFTKAALYNILNTRYNSHRKTLITTNFSIANLDQLYDNRVVSRLVGDFIPFNLVGDDIRQVLKTEKLMNI